MSARGGLAGLCGRVGGFDAGSEVDALDVTGVEAGDVVEGADADDVEPEGAGGTDADADGGAGGDCGDPTAGAPASGLAAGCKLPPTGEIVSV